MDTGFTAGKIYTALEALEGETVLLSELKKQVNEQTFNYAIGWLMRENRITLKSKGKSVFVELRA